jgi:hypothetical protein
MTPQMFEVSVPKPHSSFCKITTNIWIPTLKTYFTLLELPVEIRHAFSISHESYLQYVQFAFSYFSNDDMMKYDCVSLYHQKLMSSWCSLIYLVPVPLQPVSCYNVFLCVNALY